MKLDNNLVITIKILSIDRIFIVYYNSLGYNIHRKETSMIITETKKYNKSLKKILKNRTKELERLENIKNLIINSDNLHSLLLSEYKNIYRIEKKKGDLKEFYTARLNEKIRLIMRPVGDYPYVEIEIDEIIFEDIDDKHYGEG